MCDWDSPWTTLTESPVGDHVFSCARCLVGGVSPDRDQAVSWCSGHDTAHHLEGEVRRGDDEPQFVKRGPGESLTLGELITLLHHVREGLGELDVRVPLDEAGRLYLGGSPTEEGWRWELTGWVDLLAHRWVPAPDPEEAR